MLQRMKLSVLWHQDLLGAATDARPSVLDEEHYWDLFAQTPRSEQPDSLSVTLATEPATGVLGGIPQPPQPVAGRSRGTVRTALPSAAPQRQAACREITCN